MSKYEFQLPEGEEIFETFINTRGQRLARWNLPDIKAPKAVCILVHGVLEHASAYESIAVTMLKSHNIALYGYDQVGHGRSEGARVDIDDFQHYVDDLIQFVNMVKKENPDVPLFIMGHALGGLALGYALLRRSDLCDGAIMYSAIVEPNPALVFSRMCTSFLSRYIPSFPVGCFEQNKLTRDEDEIQHMKSDPLRYQGGLKARWAQNVLQSVPEFMSRMDEITVPMYIAHGDSDQVCRVGGAVKLHENILSKDKTLKIYDDCYHRLHSEPNGAGEKFVADVCDWISQRSS